MEFFQFMIPGYILLVSCELSKAVYYLAVGPVEDEVHQVLRTESFSNVLARYVRDDFAPLLADLYPVVVHKN